MSSSSLSLLSWPRPLSPSSIVVTRQCEDIRHHAGATEKVQEETDLALRSRDGSGSNRASQELIQLCAIGVEDVAAMIVFFIPSPLFFSGWTLALYFGIILWVFLIHRIHWHSSHFALVNWDFSGLHSTNSNLLSLLASSPIYFCETRSNADWGP